MEPNSTKVIETNERIRSCSLIFENEQVECEDNRIIVTSISRLVYEKIIVVYDSGRSEMINIKRSTPKIIAERNKRKMENKKITDKTAVFYGFNYTERIQSRNFYDRRHRLTIKNKLNQVYWDINLFTIDNSINEAQPDRVWFTTRVSYKNASLFLANMGSRPEKGTSFLNARIYGLSALYKDKEYLLNYKVGKEGFQYETGDKTIHTVSAGKRFRGKNKIESYFSFGTNDEDDISVLGNQTSFAINGTSTLFEIQQGRKDNQSVNSYNANISIPNILKTDLVSWQSSRMQGLLQPDGVVLVGGIASNRDQSRYILSNNFDIHLNPKYGKLKYGNTYNYSLLGNTNTLVQNHSLTYAYRDIRYSFGYGLLENNLGTSISRLRNTVSYDWDLGSWKHGVSLSHMIVDQVRNNIYSTGVSYNIKTSGISVQNRVLENIQIMKNNDQSQKSYQIVNRIRFEDLIYIDFFDITNQSSFVEDINGDLYNNLNRYGLSVSKKWDNHQMRVNSTYGVNRSYRGKFVDRTFGFNYVYSFAKKHNVVSNFVYSKSIVVGMYSDRNFNNVRDKDENEVMEDITVQLYDRSSGEIEQEILLKKGTSSLVFSGLDSRREYYLSIKEKNFKLSNSNLAFEGVNDILVQKYVDQNIVVKDIVNDEIVSSAEIQVFCPKLGYRRKYTGVSGYGGYSVSYPVNYDCVLSIDSKTSDVFYNMVYDENLPKEKKESIEVVLERYNTLIIKTENFKGVALKKKISYNGKLYFTDDLGFVEIKIDTSKGGQKVLIPSLIKQNRSLKGCLSDAMSLNFNEQYYVSREVNFKCP